MNVLLCPLSDHGYLYPALAIGRELRRRGASVQVLGYAAAGATVAAAGLPFVPPTERLAFSVGRWMIGGQAQFHAVVRAARETRADVLVTSVLAHGALLAAQTLDLPVVVIGLATHLWEYGTNDDDVRVWRTSDMMSWYTKLREDLGVAAPTGFPLVGTALLLRGDPALEPPGSVLPEPVHQVGPCSWEPTPDPAELDGLLHRLDRVGKPVVYVHLGRTFGGECPWTRINATFTDGPFQAVVEVGRTIDRLPAPDADLIVVRKPWMGPLVDRAGLVLTNGTSAPVLNGLLRGRPLGVTPAGSEQPLLAEACVRAGVAVTVPNDPGPDPVGILRSAWDDSGLRARAGDLGRRLAEADGATRAADVVQLAAAGSLSTAPRQVAHHRVDQHR